MAGTSISAAELVRLRWRARTLALPSRRPVKSVIAGVHLSRFRGRGVDYLESRHYEVGDDIRDLDWRVTARTGEPHTKIFQEERERPVIVVVDFDQRMFFGTRERLKSVMAAELAALIGWTATRRGDRIGSIIFSGPAHHEVPVRGGRRGALRLIRGLDQSFQRYRSSAASEAGLPAALQRLRRIVRPGSLVILLSDFASLCPGCERDLSRLVQHNDLFAVQILDPIEEEIPPPDRYPVTDGSQIALLDLVGRRAREAYRQAVIEPQLEAVRRLTRCRIPVLKLSTRDDAARALMTVSARSPAQHRNQPRPHPNRR